MARRPHLKHELKGKVAVVTGAAGTMGRAVMDCLAADGIRMIGICAVVRRDCQTLAAKRTPGGMVAFRRSQYSIAARPASSLPENLPSGPNTDPP